MGVDATAVGTGQMAASYRLALTFDGDPGEIRPRSWARPRSSHRATPDLAGSFGVEIGFYRTFADRIKARIHALQGSWATDDFTDFLLLLEDLAPREQGDQIAGYSVEQATTGRSTSPACTGRCGATPWLAEHLLPYDGRGVGLDAVAHR